jgi:hypothetical protein
MPKIDDFFVTSLEKQEYFESFKNFKLKKGLRKTAVGDKEVENLSKEKVLFENSEFCWSLYKKCNIKSLKKKWRGSNIR